MTISRQRTQAVLNVLKDKRINEYITLRSSSDAKWTIVELEPGLLMDKFQGQFEGDGEVQTSSGIFHKLRATYRGVIFIAFVRKSEVAA